MERRVKVVASAAEGSRNLRKEGKVTFRTATPCSLVSYTPPASPDLPEDGRPDLPEDGRPDEHICGEKLRSGESSDLSDCCEGHRCDEPPRKKKNLRSLEDACSNRQILGLRCSEAFRLVAACRGIKEDRLRYEWGFGPLIEFLVRVVMGLITPAAGNPDEFYAFGLRDRMEAIRKTSEVEKSHAREWLPFGDVRVEELIDKAVTREFSFVHGRLGSMSEWYVAHYIKKAAKKIISACVLMNDLVEENCDSAKCDVLINIVPLIPAISSRVEFDPNFMGLVESFYEQTKKPWL